MILAELGHSLLLTALVLAVVGCGAPLLLARRHSLLGLRFAQINGAFLGGLFVICLALLLYAFVTSDFSLKVVTLNSQAQEALMYRLVALWGNHEGSLLLWITTLSLYTVAFSFSGRGIATDLDRTRMLSCLSLMLASFVGFLLITSNPFEKLSMTPHKGLGLNPILQDPSMTFHPPSLYFGYIGFVIPFAMAVGFLWRGHFKKEHAAWMRWWTLLPWSFLTFGVTAGSLWAYYELGWGGWWAWDPVENASILPWLTGTALLHTLGAYRRSSTLKATSLGLALLTWLMSLVGTYITRSGVVASVHGFAQDDQRGFYLLGMVTVLTVLSLVLFLGRLRRFQGMPLGDFPARPRLIQLQVIAFMGATLLLTVATLYPIWGQGTLAESFYDHIFTPLACVLLGLMGLTTFMGWQNPPQGGVWPLLKMRLIPVNSALLVLVLLMTSTTAPKTFFALVIMLVVAFAVWVVGASLRAWMLKKSEPVMLLAHIAFAVSVVGMGGDALFHQEQSLWLTRGQAQPFVQYGLRLEAIHQDETPTYRREMATVSLLNYQGQIIGTLKPETRLYKTQQVLVSKTSILNRYWAQIYLVLGPELETGQRSFRVFYHPFVVLIWMGGFGVAAAGLLAFGKAYLSRRRRRQ